jgi:histone acetyltransferase (RNA polymerase elongator complex component)
MLVIPLFISHYGCPHQCLFCNQEKIAGSNSGAAENFGDIERTIEQWLPRAKGNEEVQVAFYGGSFTCLPEPEQERLLAQVQKYRRRGQIHAVRLSTRPDCISSECCEFLRKQGVTTVELGVQSLSDTVLRASRRGHDSTESCRAVQLLHKLGFTVGVQLMVGLPGETTVSFLRGIATVALLAPSFVRLYPCLVIAGSELAEQYRRGLYHPLSLRRAVALVTLAYTRLTAAGIRVIRMGLQPTEELAQALLAGPFHPAFGELVVSRWWLHRLRSRLAALQPQESLAVTISPRDRSALVGMHKYNLNRLGELGFAKRLTITTDQTQRRGTIRYAVS